MDELLPSEAVSPAENVYGDGGVAHQIIGAFLVELEMTDEACKEIAERLTKVLFQAKPSEDDLRTALFGEVEL